MASQSGKQEGAEGRVSEILASMESYASSGDWERVEVLAIRLRSVVMQVPLDKRRDVMLATRRSLTQVQSMAQFAHHDTAEKLTAIRRGKHVTRAYAAAE